ncbi:unnamed protein product [Parnassius apollo]|uniref:(apollo) hypothetical protein n=1 Tax=Parnassius apollo TaxID=110799 RepID=A0A8S3WYV7_PARAO|nr:unnamed protein product [Parnassius apollo]
MPQKESEIKVALIEGWRRGQRLLEEFKYMFSNRYLSMLRERTQRMNRQPHIVSKKNPEIGDIVQIKGDNNNRSTWKTGKIVTLYRSKDRQVRVASVRVGDKEYNRSIAHLYPPEIDCKEGVHTSDRSINKVITDKELEGSEGGILNKGSSDEESRG